MEKDISKLKNIIISKFIEFRIIQYGTFTLKSGKSSLIYIDMRRMVSYPMLFKYIEMLIDLKYPDLFNKSYSHISRIIGIPLGGVPLASYLSYSKNLPQLLLRDKPKTYGTKQILEGVYNPEDAFILIEDVITTGQSITTTLKNLKQNEIHNSIKDILVICDRTDNEEVNLHFSYKALFTKYELLNFKAATCAPFNHPIFDKFYQTSLLKKSNIIVSCDYQDFTKIEALLKIIGNLIIGIKLHADIIHNFNSEMLEKIKSFKTEYNILVIEDRKLADIEHIELQQITTHPTNILEWADAITCHGIMGELSNDFLRIVQAPIIITELSVVSSITNDIIQRIISNMRITRSSVGLVCQSKTLEILKDNPFEYPTFSPGIHFSMKNDGLNQSYNNPDTLQPYSKGLFWIIGRGITDYTNVDDIIAITKKYKSSGWNYFLHF